MAMKVMMREDLKVSKDLKVFRELSDRKVIHTA